MNLFSDIEAKHLQLSIDQIDKPSMDYHPSTSSIDIDKCSSTNTSLNSSSSSLSNRNSSSKLVKTNRLIKQRKSSPIKSDGQPTNFDDYPAYEHYYPPSSSSSNSHSFYPTNSTSYPHSNEANYYEQKRFRLDNDHHQHHHAHLFDYQSNLSADKLDFYSSNYPTDHPYHHTSVIVDSQQYFFNGWNGTTAF